MENQKAHKYKKRPDPLQSGELAFLRDKNRARTQKQNSSGSTQ
ncbi:hypothetical protein HOLDEFILI_00169 [Holdemania filiformis DSM 12042]|uniref:Uncharacterized protein n=1 Tax=Holdemania filiformis DSM 12042 TaxID=545696 RepID=B9Y2Z4_9FIRM|nr:hypothetical protein HOLDEFILI_00169 [Holdemania filiformis DSM 12042]